MNNNEGGAPPKSLLRAITSDIQFWIPLVVLMAGLLFLSRLR